MPPRVKYVFALGRHATALDAKPFKAALAANPHLVCTEGHLNPAGTAREVEAFDDRQLATLQTHRLYVQLLSSPAYAQAVRQNHLYPEWGAETERLRVNNSET
ncbi:MAG: hypothetical protein AABW54_04330 [Candidatus Micrarchaeota archaeon]